MALYIDSAFLDDIIQVAKTVPVAGVTTNPTLLLAAYERGQRLDATDLLQELLQNTSGTIFMQPGATTEDEMFVECLTYIGGASDRVIPKIPMTQIGMRVALRLRYMNYRISFTAVTSVAQAYSAAMARADFIIPYFNRLERSGINGSERIARMAEVVRTQQTRILAASIKSQAEAATALIAGAHDLTVPPQVLQEMIVDPQSEQAVEKFTRDWQKMKML